MFPSAFLTEAKSGAPALCFHVHFIHEEYLNTMFLNKVKDYRPLSQLFTCSIF